MKLMVFIPAMPSYPHLHPAAIRSVDRLQWPEPFQLVVSRFDHPASQVGSERIRDYSEKYIWAQKLFLSGDWDAMLTVEYDMLLPADTLAKLASVDADIVYGLYCNRPSGRHTWMLRVGEDISPAKAHYPPEYMRSVWGKVVPSDGLGMGCTLIHRRVLEAVTMRYSEQLGNDYFLAKDARAAGFVQKTDCRVQVGHILEPGKAVWPHPEKTYQIKAF